MIHTNTIVKMAMKDKKTLGIAEKPLPPPPVAMKDRKTLSIAEKPLPPLPPLRILRLIRNRLNRLRIRVRWVRSLLDGGRFRLESERGRSSWNSSGLAETRSDLIKILRVSQVLYGSGWICRWNWGDLDISRSRRFWRDLPDDILIRRPFGGKERSSRLESGFDETSRQPTRRNRILEVDFFFFSECFSFFFFGEMNVFLYLSETSVSFYTDPGKRTKILIGR